jgi:hypothetical protein
MRAPLLLPLLLLSCTTHRSQLTNPGKQVEIVQNLPAEQNPHLADLGNVVVEQSWEFRGDEDDAKNQLRNHAARDGASVVLLQEDYRVPCEVDSKKNCVVLKGKKYRRADSGERPSEQL